MPDNKYNAQSTRVRQNWWLGSWHVAVVDRGGPWLAIWVNGNIRNLDQPAENYMQPYSMRRSGKAQRWTKHQRCKTSKAQQWKPSKTSAVQNQNGKHRRVPPKQKPWLVLYIVRLYDGTMVQRHLSTEGRGTSSKSCTTKYQRQAKKLLYNSNYQCEAKKTIV